MGNILPGITRATVLELCDELNIPVEEKAFVKEAIYGADAAFFCGTAAEVIGFQSLDDQPFAIQWENTVSKQIQDAYKNLIVENKMAMVNEVIGVE